MRKDQRVHERQLKQTAQVATFIAEMFKPCLGPRGTVKLVEDEEGIWLTDSPSLVLERITSQHPITRILAEASTSVFKGVGDGVCTFIILVGELLRSCNGHIGGKTHPNIVVDGWKKALDYCLANLDYIEIDRNDKKQFTDVSRTVVCFGLPKADENHLANLVAEVVLHFSGVESLDLSSFSVEKELGGSVADSFFVKGIALRHELGDPFGRNFIKNARIAVIKGEMIGKEFPKWKYESHLELDRELALNSALVAQKRSLTDLANRVVRSSANVLVIEKGIHPIAMSHLTRNGVMVIRRVVIEALERVAKATGGTVVNDISDLLESDLGFAGVVKSRTMHNEEWVFIEKCLDPKAATLVIRAQSDTLLHSVGRLAERGVKAARKAYTSGRLVFGGGAFEASLAHKLRSHASKHEGRQQLAILWFADALEAIPMTLARNAGMNPMSAIAELRARQAAGDVAFGVDHTCRTISDMKKLGVLDPLVVKKRVLATAFGIAAMLLRIDTHLSKPLLRTKEERLKKEREKYLEPERVRKIQQEHNVD